MYCIQGAIREWWEWLLRLNTLQYCCYYWNSHSINIIILLCIHSNKGKNPGFTYFGIHGEFFCLDISGMDRQAEPIPEQCKIKILLEK